MRYGKLLANSLAAASRSLKGVKGQARDDARPMWGSNYERLSARARDRVRAAFDPAYYLKTYPDVAAGGLDPFEHYMGHGWREMWRNPSAEFDTSDYAFALSFPPGVNPFVHWVLHGKPDGLSGRPGGIAEWLDRLSADDRARLNEAFDDHYYLNAYPDIVGAPVSPLEHYLKYGWREGRDPSPDFSTSWYHETHAAALAPGENPFVHWALRGARAGVPGRPPAGGPDPVTGDASGAHKPKRDERMPDEAPERLRALWHEIGALRPDEPPRPDFRFDPAVYEGSQEESGHRDVERARRSWLADPVGPATTYARDVSGAPDAERINARLGALIVHPSLREALDQDVPGAHELAFELLALGEPVDRRVSGFSARYYSEYNRDIPPDGATPLLHYLRHGIDEGRRSFDEVRRLTRPGRRAPDPSLPTCLIGVHAMSGTGAPAVALDLVERAARNHNVLVASLTDGPLADRFLENACAVMVMPDPGEQFDYADAPGIGDVAWAILNSSEAYAFVPALVERDVPIVTYVHEYADYVLPPFKRTFVGVYSDRLLFSSEHVRDTWSGLLIDHAVADDDVRLVPQREVSGATPPPEAVSEARERVGQALGLDITGRRLVYGAGELQWRKGTDLFAVTAARAARQGSDAVFVWIGDGHNAEDPHFGVWMGKHLREAGANLPGGTFHTRPAGPLYRDLCVAADALFLPSRMDPLPNVVFDALENGCAVVAFEAASGFDDDRYGSLERLHRVPYGDTGEALAVLERVPDKTSRSEGNAESKTAVTHGAGTGSDGADIGPDVRERILQIAKELTEKSPRPDGGVSLPPDAYCGTYDVSLLYPNPKRRDARRLERERLARLSRLAIWRDANTAVECLSRSTHWVHRSIDVRDCRPVSIEPTSDGPAFNVHIHAFYLDTLERDLASYAAFSRARRIVVTTDAMAKADEIAATGERLGLPVEPSVVENRGRDVLPFLDLVTADSPHDEIWCHLHQKKSLGTALSGDAWRAFLFDMLLGDAGMVSSAIEEIARDDVGLVGALDPHVLGWGGARALLPTLAYSVPDQVPDQPPEHPILFPVGNMFWVRAGTVEAMKRMFDGQAWPAEPTASDGTVYHLIERLWPTASAMTDRRSVFLHREGAVRS